MKIDGVLDLHAFRPSEIGDLVPAYVQECLARGILDLRIIHGKGKGVLKSRVESLLRSLDSVESFRPADESAGGWGATLVRLRRPA